MKRRENQNPQRSIDKKPQRVGRELEEETKTWIQEQVLSFKELCDFRCVITLNFSMAISLFSNELNINYTIRFGQ